MDDHKKDGRPFDEGELLDHVAHSLLVQQLHSKARKTSAEQRGLTASAEDLALARELLGYKKIDE